MAYGILPKVRSFSAAASLLALVCFSGWFPAYGDSAQTTKLLQEVRTSASQISRDAALMQSYSLSQKNWRIHAAQIDLIKEHVNRAGKALADLHNARDGAEPWQQEAIDRTTPLLQEMASHTTSIIDHLNDTKQPWQPQYQGYLKSNAETAADLSKLIGDYLDYGGSKAKSDAIGQKLGISGS